jgi:hypothetical protein
MEDGGEWIRPRLQRGFRPGIIDQWSVAAAQQKIKPASPGPGANRLLVRRTADMRRNNQFAVTRSRK